MFTLNLTCEVLTDIDASDTDVRAYYANDDDDSAHDEDEEVGGCVLDCAYSKPDHASFAKTRLSLLCNTLFCIHGHFLPSASPVTDLLGYEI
jgi:hypothetical protein